jgi:hypothetical protein
MRRRDGGRLRPARIRRVAVVTAALLGWASGVASAGLFTSTASAGQPISTATLTAPTLSLSCTGTGGLGGTVSLSWTAVSRAQGYSITRTGGLIGTRTWTTTGTSTTDTIPVLTVLSVFTYKVTATAGSAWTGPASAGLTATFPLLTTCTVP